MAMATTRDAELGQKRPMKLPNRPNSSVGAGLEAPSTRLAAQGCVATSRRPTRVDRAGPGVGFATRRFGIGSFKRGESKDKLTAVAHRSPRLALNHDPGRQNAN